MNKEIRQTLNKFELVQDNPEEMILRGYAIKFNSPTVIFTDQDGINYYETIDAGALDQADLSDVVLRYNHVETFPILARTKNNSLSLSIDEKGLLVEAKLIPTNTNKDIFQMVQSDLLNKMSFGFYTDQDYIDLSTRTRHIQKIESLFDVSIVDFPAYQDTSITTAQNIQKLELEKEKLKLLAL